MPSNRAFEHPIRLPADGKEIAFIEPHAAAAPVSE
jgi:hypothetical protein